MLRLDDLIENNMAYFWLSNELFAADLLKSFSPNFI